MVVVMQKAYEEIYQLYRDVLTERDQAYQYWEKKIERPHFKSSAQNLLAYLAIRRRDIRPLQTMLAPYGLSTLGRLEGKTIPTLKATLASLEHILQLPSTVDYPTEAEFGEEFHQLNKNAIQCYGPRPEKHGTRIMVTLPREAAQDIALLDHLMTKGMNVARINCAHDNQTLWQQMIDNIHLVSRRHGRTIPILMDIAGPKIRTEWIYTQLKNPKVKKGDLMRITSNFEKLPDNTGILVTAGCSVKDIYKAINVNDPVLMDDGSVESRVVSCNEEEFILEVKKVKGTSIRVKAEKGLNFPNSNFDFPLLDTKDKSDFTFAMDHADIIGLSFVRTAKDIREIQDFMVQVQPERANDIHLMAKIETVQAFENLGDIILTAAGKNPFSVMIARGDLAVESGYVRLAEIQEQILWICESASIPVVWGTEVLANLVNTGVPTRSEITDAARGIQAEVVMLNKGDYIVEGVEMLNSILSKMEQHYYKKTPRLRKLSVAKEFTHEIDH